MSEPTLAVRRPGCPPPIAVERSSVGDTLPEVATHLTTCALCRAELESLQARTQAFNLARPPERFLAQLSARSFKPARKQPLPFRALAGVAAALVLVLVGWRVSESGPGVTMKGPGGSISVKRGAQVWLLTEGEALTQGDALRFSVHHEQAGFAAVLMRDGQGKVQVVAPFDATAAQAIPAGTTVLDDSAVLDASTGKHTLALVVSNGQLDLAALTAQLQQGRSPSCAGCRIDLVTFDKR